jgi:hypothetical protein
MTMTKIRSAGRWLTPMVVHQPRPERFDEHGDLIERGTLGYAAAIEWECSLPIKDAYAEAVAGLGDRIHLERDGYEFDAFVSEVRMVPTGDRFIVTFVPTGPIEQFSR